MRNNRPWTTFLIILTILLIFVVFFIGSIDPGNYDLGIIIFPVVFIEAFFKNEITFIFILIGALQFPLYGILLDSFKKRKQRLFIILLIFIVHGTLAWAIMNFGMTDLIIEK